ncbi:deubiquitinase DESI2-like isoform X2 [Panicum virgatum]|uniref:deubiquitinase DESI2-like isoform X2 n=1 Tax=Panicum virgatum TaxID=38727 RepID=UPI0019D55F1B|nr:deubiquitinase DESI2-like isoform X2 [Panicum virgatum]XP_039784027.1 deubiquitinase DESI2-like isoform X2 [Panicum virgatum]
MAKRRSRFAFAWFGCFVGQARAKKMAEDGYPVKLHIYDLSQGMARQLSATILGKAIEAIWHTGVVVYGREYYFGGGIQEGQPGRTPYGTPIRVEHLGVTHVPREVFEDFLREIGPRYTPATYNLLNHNCNNFSDEAAQFLAGARLPSYILELPKEVMNSPIGALIMPMIQGLETSLRAGAVPQPPQIRPASAPVAAAAAAATQPSANDVEARSPAADEPEAPSANDVVARSPAADEPEAPSANDVEARPVAADKPEAGETPGNGDDGGSTAVPPAVQPAAGAAHAQVSAAPAAVATEAAAAAPPDPLAEAKRRVQEEIKREFAAIMAAGTARAGEAAALSTRRVMERHGLQRAAQRG